MTATRAQASLTNATARPVVADLDLLSWALLAGVGLVVGAFYAWIASGDDGR
jgi:hypothetical protein